MTKPMWLKSIENELGRPLRVLHLGNVANNAYLNAKIMRQAGIDADAVSYDYYHVMGTPEWEDCDFSGKYGDPFFPDWWNVNLKGFNRPSWFIQGPKKMCQDLIKLKKNSNTKSSIYQDMLNFNVQYICYRTSPLFNWPKNPLILPKYIFRRLKFYLFAFMFLIKKPKAAWIFIDLRKPWLTKTLITIFKISSAPVAFIGFSFSVTNSIVKNFFKKEISLNDGSVKKYKSSINDNRSKQILKSHYKQARKVIFERKYLIPIITKVQIVGSRIYLKITGRKFSNDFKMTFGAMVLRSLREEQKILLKLQKHTETENRLNILEISRKSDFTELINSKHKKNILKESIYLKNIISLYNVLKAAEMKHLVKIHKEIHTETSNSEVKSDMVMAYQLSEGWQEIFDYYDLVQCYAVDCILPMSCGLDDFFAYSHGTLRVIPFKDEVIGRLSRTGYVLSKKVMVTNVDNLAKCDLLGLTESQVVCLPHAMDDKKLLGYKEKFTHIKPNNSKPPLFLSPSRHDWVDGDLNFAKGNDHFLRAIKILMDEGFDMRIVLIEWGRHLEESKSLIIDLEIGHLIKWVKPMKKSDLWKAYFSAHAIVDQFTIPAFGSVTFEALTFGKRVISRIDTPLATRFFGECPPIMNSWDAVSVANAMRKILTDPEDKNKLESQTAEWAKKYHSSDTIMKLQLEAYKDTLNHRIKQRREIFNQISPLSLNNHGLTSKIGTLVDHYKSQDIQYN